MRGVCALEEELRRQMRAFTRSRHAVQATCAHLT